MRAETCSSCHFDVWVGTTESRFERHTEENILKHRPRTFKGQSATLSFVGCFADCKVKISDKRIHLNFILFM